MLSKFKTKDLEPLKSHRPLPSCVFGILPCLLAPLPLSFFLVKYPFFGLGTLLLSRRFPSTSLGFLWVPVGHVNARPRLVQKRPLGPRQSLWRLICPLERQHQIMLLGFRRIGVVDDNSAGESDLRRALADQNGMLTSLWIKLQHRTRTPSQNFVQRAKEPHQPSLWNLVLRV